jgi:hypothetical protein
LSLTHSLAQVDRAAKNDPAGTIASFERAAQSFKAAQSAGIGGTVNSFMDMEA